MRWFRRRRRPSPPPVWKEGFITLPAEVEGIRSIKLTTRGTTTRRCGRTELHEPHEWEQVEPPLELRHCDGIPA